MFIKFYISKNETSFEYNYEFSVILSTVGSRTQTLFLIGPRPESVRLEKLRPPRPLAARTSERPPLPRNDVCPRPLYPSLLIGLIVSVVDSIMSFDVSVDISFLLTSLLVTIALESVLT